MNEKAEKTLFGKAMEFLGSTFKAEEGAYQKGVQKAAEKRIGKASVDLREHAKKIATRTGTAEDDVVDKMTTKGANIIKEHNVDIDNAQHSGKFTAIMDSLSGGSKIKDAADLEKRAGGIQRKINRQGFVEAGKGYFTDPYKTMINKEASDEARSLAKRQFIGRTGAAAAGVGTVGAIGYNLSQNDDKDKVNAIGAGVGTGALGTAGAAGISMLKKL